MCVLIQGQLQIWAVQVWDFLKSETRVGLEQYLAGNIDGGQKITEV